jgi:hypothetical protein
MTKAPGEETGGPGGDRRTHSAFHITQNVWKIQKGGAKHDKHQKSEGKLHLETERAFFILNRQLRSAAGSMRSELK